ncbi:MAG TPA: hypothetical protein VIC60_12675 [Thermomicrobiales bacterium]
MQPPPAAVSLPQSPPSGYVPPSNAAPAGGSGGAIPPSAYGTPVIKVVRGNTIPGGAQSVPFPAGAPNAAQSAFSSGSTVRVAGAPVPAIIPRTGYPATEMRLPLGIIAGIVAIATGVWMRRRATVVRSLS